MSETDNDHPWVTSDHGTIERFTSGRDVTPAAVPTDGADRTGELRIATGAPGEDAVELEWDEFFDRMDDRDEAVAVSYDDEVGTWAFDVVSRADERPDEEVPASMADLLSSNGTDDPSEAHHERATDEVNQDNHRDGEPFQS